ncbi:hypothetical protein B5X24_HaOG213381 [Helicoverpa armigera]|uniref:Uncharacterized protein n=1 Tax=Helicoverpa armigera TaxID=29058 RepID=A0A2W1B9K4_HELAM|nr:hypothetical protein B5X24_HaOG213381 [Helicoverpa armigera]
MTAEVIKFFFEVLLQDQDILAKYDEIISGLDIKDPRLARYCVITDNGSTKEAGAPLCRSHYLFGENRRISGNGNGNLVPPLCLTRPRGCSILRSPSFEDDFTVVQGGKRKKNKNNDKARKSIALAASPLPSPPAVSTASPAPSPSTSQVASSQGAAKPKSAPKTKPPPPVQDKAQWPKEPSIQYRKQH